MRYGAGLLAAARRALNARRLRVGLADAASADGCADLEAPALRALRERHPLPLLPQRDLATVERLHAEAELARQQALRAFIRAVALETRAERLPSASAAVREGQAARLRSLSRQLDAHANRVFTEARRLGGDELCAAAPPLPALRTWLARLAEADPTIDATVDENQAIWMSFFRTLAEHVDLAGVRRALGVGTGYDGPEEHYNQWFDEHLCLDLVDYSARNPRLKYVVGDILGNVDLPDSSFDLIYSHSAFEHVKDVGRALAQVDRLARLGGHVYITARPLYYSPQGSHVNVPVKLTRWEHLDPASEYYLLEAPHLERIDTGFYLNKTTISDFLGAVGKVGWEIRHFGVEILHPREVPEELARRFPLVDLVVEEYRFVGRKVIPKSPALEW